MTEVEAWRVVLDTMYCGTRQAQMTVDMLVRLGLLKLDPPRGGRVRDEAELGDKK